MNEIRPVALCVFRNNDGILVFEGYDDVKGETFYRPPGGGIEFGESLLCNMQYDLLHQIPQHRIENAALVTPVRFHIGVQQSYIHRNCWRCQRI
jgi:hypothetical protein